VKCWGDNAFGELGDGTTTNSSTPVTVSGLTGATAIAAGGEPPDDALETDYEHTCALVAGGQVKCWGNNQIGQLGNGTTTSSSTPVTVSTLTGANGVGLTPLTGATAIAAGGYHTCALVSGGKVECWGYNNYGQLGNGTRTDSHTPVTVSGVSGATEITAGYQHTCARVSGGFVKCWGYNMDGELGNGVDGHPLNGNGPGLFSSTPVTVARLAGATAIVAGHDDTCALVSGGAARCWGLNSAGALGDGTTRYSNTPVPVTGLSGATAIAAGWGFNCAVVAGGAARCWGDNAFGELGNGTATDSLTPVSVSGLSGATAITAGSGSFFACALVSGGPAKCWGNNFDGQLGDGTTDSSSIPVDVTGVP
jgi:alpha-tubulin suppressor-like RCC1 family protein